MATVGGKLFYASNSKEFMNHSCTNIQFPDILKAQPSLTRVLRAVCNQLHVGPQPLLGIKRQQGRKGEQGTVPTLHLGGTASSFVGRKNHVLQNHFQRGMEMKQKGVSPSKAQVSSSTGRDLPCMWDNVSIHMYALLLEPNLTQLLTRATFGGVFSFLRFLQQVSQQQSLLHSHLTPELPPSEAMHSEKPQTFGLPHPRPSITLSLWNCCWPCTGTAGGAG